MSLISMTGFARADGALGNARWHWELRSVNGKGFDVRFRLPQGFEALEARLREELGKHVKRGNCQASLTIDKTASASAVRVNEEALRAVLEAVTRLQRDIELMPPRPEGILALKGVLETGEAEVEDDDARAAMQAAVFKTFAEAAAGLAAARAEEGQKLADILTEQLARIEAMRARLKSQVSELLAASPALSEERLAQEAALLATKADVREEIDRLGAHISQARELLRSGEPAGRRLDFLTQEFNREANTLCSKAADVALTRIGLELKAVVDQLREQVQNVE